MRLLLQLPLLSLQQPELDPVTQAATKAELDRGIDKTTGFPVDGGCGACRSLQFSSSTQHGPRGVTDAAKQEQACTDKPV